MTMSERPDKREQNRAPQLAPRSRLRAFVLLAITLGGIFACFLLTVPFLPALAWAMALAILFVPAHRWVEAKLNNPHLAATVSVLWIALIVVVPITFLGSRIVAEAAQGAATLTQMAASGEWLRSMEGYDALALVAQWIKQMDLPGAIGNVASWLASTSASFVRDWFWQLVTVVLTFYLLFYFLRDHKIALAWLRENSPLSEAETNLLFARIVDTVHATLYGTVMVAAVQGTLGGLMFWWLGLPTPLLWGLAMGVMAIVPVLGAFVIWIPAAIFLALDGSWGKALILTAWGAVVVGGVDNLLYPMLVGNRLKLHTVPTFISIVGGLSLFGASGLLLGPLIFTVTIFCLEIWRVRVGHPRRGQP
jgi:predicted PurR-regulated permease PerM